MLDDRKQPEIDQLLIDPGTGLRAWINEGGGITLAPLDSSPDALIAISLDEASELAEWLQKVLDDGSD